VAEFVGRPAIETDTGDQSLELLSTDHRVDRMPGGGGEDHRVRVRPDLADFELMTLLFGSVATERFEDCLGRIE
jgi:hypothetical protein